MTSASAILRDERIHALIADYLDREAAGQAPSRATWLSEHAEHAEELRRFLDEHERMARLGSPLRDLAAPAAGCDAVTVGAGAGNTLESAPPVRFFGDYELLEEIARGGMGVVYKARQKSLNRTVALKMILAGQLATTTDVQRFQTEAAAAGQLDHPNIVPIYEVGAHDGQHYFSMKLIEGASLAQAIAADRWPRQTREGQQAIGRLVATAARAVHYAHQRGILHRDLKPANILLSGRSDRMPTVDAKRTAETVHDEPHITDFGLAKRVGGESSLTHTGAVVGTPAYMPPEQASGTKQLTVAADVYSLGAILYEMLTGQPPFRGDSALSILAQVCSDETAPPRSVNAALDRDLSTICLRCLEKDAPRRYPSAESFAEDLERWLVGEPIVARPSTAWERTVKWAKRRPAAAALVGVSVVSAAALLMVGLVFNTQLSRALDKVWKQQHKLDEAEAVVAQAQQDVVKEQAEAKAANAQAQELLVRAKSLRLVAQSEVVRADQPTLALLLALEAARLGPRRADHNNALVKALAECREIGPLLADDNGHKVSHVRWFADGRRALTVSTDTVRIWDVPSGKKLVEVPGPRLRITSVALSPDDQWLALTFEDHYEYNAIEVNGKPVSKSFVVSERAARVYDTRTGIEKQVLRGHQRRVSSVAFSQDSKRIVTTSWDGAARTWDVVSGKELKTLIGHECQLAFGEFTANNRVLTVSSGIRVSKFADDVDSLVKKYSSAAIDPPLPFAFRPLAGGASRSGGGSQAQGESLFACLWDTESGAKVTEFRTSLRGDNKCVRGARLDPTGKHLVAVNMTGALVFDGQTGHELRQLAHPCDPSSPPEFSPDGKRVLLFSRVAIRIFDVDSGKEVVTLHAETDDIRSARFRPDPEGKYVLTTSDDKSARLWEVATGAEVFSLRGHEQGVIAAEFSPDGRRVITGSNDRTARIWNAELSHAYERMVDTESHQLWFGPRARKPLDPRVVKNAVWSAKFRPDGKQIATGSKDGTLRLWDVESGKLVAAQRGLDKVDNPKLRDAILREVFAVSFSPDGKRVLTVSADAVGKLIQPGKTKVQAPPLPFAPLRVYDAANGAALATLDGHPEAVRFAWFSPDGTRVLTVAGDRFRTFGFHPQSGLPSGSGGGNSNDRTARIFDSATGQQLHVFTGNWDQIHSACWDAEGERVCTVHLERDQRGIPHLRVIRVWNVRTGKTMHELIERDNNVTKAAFSPDGRRLLTWHDSRLRQNSSSGQTSLARVWDLTSGKPLFSMKGPQGAANTATYSPDGKWIVTTGYTWNSSESSERVGVHGRLRDSYFADRTARLWDAETGALVATLYGHERSVHDAAFSADSRWLVTCSEDRTARVWDVATAKEFITLRGHEDDVKTAEFSPDAKLVLTVSWDGTARLWPVDPLPIAQARRPRELTDEERERFEVTRTR